MRTKPDSMSDSSCWQQVNEKFICPTRRLHSHVRRSVLVCRRVSRRFGMNVFGLMPRSRSPGAKSATKLNRSSISHRRWECIFISLFGALRFREFLRPSLQLIAIFELGFRSNFRRDRAAALGD